MTKSMRVGIGLGLAGALLLTGCSGSTSGSGSTDTAGTGSSAAAPTSSASSESSSSSATRGTPATVIKASLAAAKAAKTVRVAGSGKDSGSVISLDFHYGSNGSKGFVSNKGTRIDLTVVGATVYFKAPDSFWRQQLGSKAAQVLPIVSGKWVRVPATSTQASSFQTFTDRAKLIASFTEGFDAAKAASIMQVGTSTVDGMKTISYRDPSDKSTIDVAASGTPYLLRAIDPDASDGGTVTFTDWNQPYTVTAPPASQIVSLPA